ncbi:tumor necrosis factor receptor superfamily member 16 isoform X1 [Nerophis lumbriciformis]|uniref:tumor necrosis factor receptor superfamily member 16 isoform X1 n=2 Tax=Nerophis lumbriciformis TaxID=546530 RepID=UPI002ADFD3DD|nr:tumor necrosis factor receptor superfamily member 16-like isoform X1 [Nerophis lumbriciformis]
MTSFPALLVIYALVALATAASKSERAVQLPCDSGQYTKDGECCMECPPGEGVVRPCGAKQTVCAQCLDSETFSENYSHTEQCQPCIQCTGLMRMETPCTDSNDAICVCRYNFYLDGVSGRCEPCTVCLAGHGVFEHCELEHDTVCEECVDYTFSDRESSLDPCLPCTICDDETEVQLAHCTPVSDSVCHNPLLPTYFPSTSFETDPTSSTFSDYFLPDGSEGPPPGDETTTASAGSPRYLGRGLNENLIPISCSILAAVVLVGLVAYVVFKRWNSCKQNKQAANNRAAAAAATNNQTVTPEGEKLHSDSGISVDSQSLQEQHQQQQQQQHQAQADIQAVPPRSRTHEQIVVRVDGGPQPVTPPPEA